MTDDLAHLALLRQPVYLRARPIVVEGMHYDGTPESAAHIVNWANGEAYYREGELIIETLEGRHTCGPDWWVLRGTLGELYPVDPRIVAGKYEPVGETGE